MKPGQQKRKILVKRLTNYKYKKILIKRYNNNMKKVKK
jgi:hypothetical protein